MTTSRKELILNNMATVFQELMGREYFVPVPLIYDVDPALFALNAA